MSDIEPTALQIQTVDKNTYNIPFLSQIKWNREIIMSWILL